MSRGNLSVCRDPTTRGNPMKLLRATAVAAAIFVLAPPPPASAQISSTAIWSCEFVNSATDCGFNLQAFASNRATVVSPGRDGSTAAELTTQPGDSNLFGSGTAERADVDLGISAAFCNQGQDEWWAHSLMFPQNYVIPPAGSVWNWGVVFDFHHTGPTGQPNFQIASLPTGLEFWVSGGPTVVNGPTDPGFHRAAIGPVTKNVWYDFMYHVKWSSGSDGFFKAWLNGQQVMNYSGATLYVGESCYLKLANYHTPLGVPIPVIHSRVVRGATQADVQLPSSPGPTVAVPNVVGQMQAAATSAVTGAGLTPGTVTITSSSTVAAGSVSSESPSAGRRVASGSAVNLVVSTGGGTSSGGGGGPSSGGGGGGAFDSFTLAALLSSLIGGLWRARKIRTALYRTPEPGGPGSRSPQHRDPPIRR